jgi:glycosyltransferase involved in cell wall biosynthesis
VYHLGNSPLHNYIYPVLCAWPGLLVLHDAWMMGTRLAAALKHWQGDAFRQEMQMIYGDERGWDMAEIILSGLHHDSFLRHVPMSELPVRFSRMTLVHQEWLRRDLENTVSGACVRHLPHYFHTEFSRSASERRRGRGELGVDGETFLLGVFGGVVPEKQPELCLRSLSWLREQNINAHLLFVGAAGENVDIQGMIAALKLKPFVTVTGRVEDNRFYRYLQACECQLALRWPTNRESSQVLLNAMHFGLPVVTTNLAHYADFPEDVLFRIDPDKAELQLRETLLRLAGSASLRKAVGERAMNYMAEYHGAETAARKWREHIEEAAALSDPSLPGCEELPRHLQLH